MGEGVGGQEAPLETRVWAALWGSEKESLAKMRAVLAAGGDPRSVDWEGASILESAFLCGNVGAARLLIAAGANPLALSKAGETMALVAVKNKNTLSRWAEQALDLAIEAGVDPFLPDAEGRTPLMLAAKHERVGCAQRLLALGANPRAVDHRGRSAIFYALDGWDNEELLEVLLSGGAGLDQELPCGGRFLSEAAKQNDRDAVNFALGRGADVEARDGAGRSAFHAWASSCVPQPACARILLLAGAQINALDHDGATPLLLAIKARSWAAASELVSLGADPRVADAAGEDPRWACEKENPALAEELGAACVALELAESLGHERLPEGRPARL